MKIFVLMASGGLNIAHPILQFDVLRFKKPSSLKEKINLYKFISGTLAPCY
jgi:hypothetical protein